MKTPKTLCVGLDASDLVDGDDVLHQFKWGQHYLYGKIVCTDTEVMILIPSWVYQIIKLKNKRFVCPSCETAKRKLYLPTYGSQFACAECWDLDTGDGEGVKIENSPLSKLLKKFMGVLK